jgi:hypothetical protein
MVCTIIVLRMLYIIVIIQRRSLRDPLQLALMSRIFILMMMSSLFFLFMLHMALSFILLNFLNLWIYLSAVLRRHRMMNLFLCVLLSLLLNLHAKSIMFLEKLLIPPSLITLSMTQHILGV